MRGAQANGEKHKRSRASARGFRPSLRRLACSSIRSFVSECVNLCVSRRCPNNGSSRRQRSRVDVSSCSCNCTKLARYACPLRRVALRSGHISGCHLEPRMLFSWQASRESRQCFVCSNFPARASTFFSIMRRRSLGPSKRTPVLPHRSRVVCRASDFPLSFARSFGSTICHLSQSS